jgi:hypothetical protein
MSESDKPTAKVLFRVSKDGSTDVETLWAYDLGKNQYRLDNSPFYAYSVSWQDIVYAPVSSEEGFPTFQHTLSKSGHRTVKVLFDDPVEPGNRADLVLQGLGNLGCSYEGMYNKLMSVDIPPAVELEAVRQYLIQQDATWEHADPTYAELFPEDS